MNAILVFIFLLCLSNSIAFLIILPRIELVYKQIKKYMD